MTPRTVPDSVQAIVLASILHAVQQEVNAQMATHIESLTEEQPTTFIEKSSDETALYRISGWAIKSAIDYRSKKKGNEGVACPLAAFGGSIRPW